MINEPVLLAELRPWLRSKAASLLGASEQHHTEDLAQEAWIAVWKALPTRPAAITEYTELVAWCRAVAVNRMRYTRRKEIWQVSAKVRNGVPAGDFINELAEALSGSESLESVDVSYHDGKLALALDALPPRQREYVVARFWYGMSNPELAVHFGVVRPDATLWNGPRKAKERILAALSS